MGAEFDGDVTVDGHGNAMADGGVCVTLRDLARFGQLLANSGRRGARSVIPKPWIRDTLTPEPDSVEAFAAFADRFEKRHGAYYRNQFWVVDPDIPIYMGSGINGQNVFVHGGANVVIAKLSTWPVAWEDQIARDTRNAMIQLAEALA
jgi:CubicO group peptidase (beta-lactamase class C family)